MYMYMRHMCVLNYMTIIYFKRNRTLTGWLLFDHRETVTVIYALFHSEARFYQEGLLLCNYKLFPASIICICETLNFPRLYLIFFSYSECVCLIPPHII